MANGWDALSPLLPETLQRALNALPPPVRSQVQEIRLRAGQAVALGIRGTEQFITPTGAVSVRAAEGLVCPAEWLRQVVERVCDHSVYAHQEELRCGFFAAPGGCRIGVAGTAVTENGRIVSYRNITSLCIRVAREHHGCAAALAARLCRDGTVYSALLCGEPSSGKTSLLRDLLRELTARRLSVTAVDERGELTGSMAVECDILRGAPKAAGVEQAVRCLAPRAVVFDELGGEAELHAVRQALHSGVAVITSVHARTPTELLRREGVRDLLYSGAFAYVGVLRGCTAPGELVRLIRVEEWLNEMDGRDTGVRGGYGMWFDGAGEIATPSAFIKPVSATGTAVGGAGAVYGGTVG